MLDQVARTLPSIAFSVALDVCVQVLRSFAGMGAIERRWALDLAIDRSNRKAPNCLLICIIMQRDLVGCSEDQQ